MIWIFPMAGYGTRTIKYGEFKPLIEVRKGFSILKTCLTGIKELIKSDDELMFIATIKHEEKHNVMKNIKNILSDLDLKIRFKIVLLEQTPKGQALTIKAAIDKVKYTYDDRPCLVINPDQLIFFDLDSIEKSKCSVGIYFNTSSSSCFYDLEINNKKIKQIAEKNKISHYASSGVFYFNSVDSLNNCIKWGKKTKKIHNGELFLGPCMQFFKDLSYFQTLVKFDLGNENSIELFKKFTKNFL